jgi:CheY-like chemotaxis protein
MSKRILVVEDQPDNRQIIRDMLAPTDYEITEVESGEEALAAVAKQRPHAVHQKLLIRSPRRRVQPRTTHRRRDA